MQGTVEAHALLPIFLYSVRIHEKVSDLNFYKIYNSREVDVIIKINSSFVHEIFHPTLNKEAYGAFYSEESVNTAIY